MDPPVYAVDDREGRALQLVVEAAREQPTEDRITACLAVQNEVSGGALRPALDQASVDALDDVAALTERAQNAFGFLRPDPLPGTKRRREAEALQLAGARDEHRLLEVASLVADGAQVDYAVMTGSLARERLVERRPAVGVDLPLETATDFLLAARTELQGDELGGARVDRD